MLKNRLQAVYNEIENGSVVADIGCDHGKLSCELLVSNKAQKVIAVDISKESLQKTIDLKQKLNLPNLITRVGDGLQVVDKDEVDTVVIAGMGGMEIIKILSNSKNTFKKYILVPHSNSKELREYLSKRFFIKKDYLVKENKKYYFVIVAVEGKSNLTLEQLEFGNDFDNPLLKELLEKKLAEFTGYLKNAKVEGEVVQLEQKISLIKKVLNNA